MGGSNTIMAIKSTPRALIRKFDSEGEVVEEREHFHLLTKDPDFFIWLPGQIKWSKAHIKINV